MTPQNELKFIKGKCVQGMPADIYFYTDVDYWSVDNFLWEFEYLVNYVEPSKIRVHINSVGGSVVDGMSVFAKIQDCPIPTECINDALAASMGSIIWAAGNELYMKDYALLMIHNPFCDTDGAKTQTQATEAFAKQLRTIYMQRFGLSEEEVTAIMDGEEGQDGTFLTASQAVERGFLSADHVLETPKTVRDRIDAALNGSSGIAQIRAAFASVLPQMPNSAIYEQNDTLKISTMETNEISVLAVLLGLSREKATAESISAKINELKAKAENSAAIAKSLEEARAELVKVNAELTGAKTSVKNLTGDLDKAKAELKVFRDAEVKAHADKVGALIDEAITQCKINKDERDLYVEMATGNYDLAVNVLNKIPARESLSEVTATDPAEAKKGMMTEEEKALAKVKDIVGENFQFRKIQ